MSREKIMTTVLQAIQDDLRRQSANSDGLSSAAVGAPERAALAGCFDLEELAEAICDALEQDKPTLS